MTAIKPSNAQLRDKINSDSYNNTLNIINSKYFFDIFINIVLSQTLC